MRRRYSSPEMVVAERRPVATPRASRLTALELFEVHGSAVYCLAKLLVLEDGPAVALAADALLDAYGSREPEVGRRHMARLVFVFERRGRHTRPGSSDRWAPGGGGHTRADSLGIPGWTTLTWEERAVLGLAVFGRYTYTEVAELVGVSPERSAELMLSGLRTLARESRNDAGTKLPSDDW